MEIIYLIIGGNWVGVDKKLTSKIQSLNNNGIKTKGLVFSTANVIKKNSNHFEVIPIKIKAPKVLKGFFFWRFLKFYNEFKTFQKIGKELKKHKFNFVIFRYPGSNYALYSFTKKFKKKVIFELNARTLTDRIKYNSHNSFTDKYLIFSERYFFHYVIKNAIALISVTKDILSDEIERANVELPSLVLENGINANSIKARKVPLIKDNTIKICIAIGASNNLVFGLERLALGISEYKGKMTFQVFIAGNIQNQEIEKLNILAKDCCFFSLGVLDSDGLHRMYSNCHVAFAALAMYKLNANYSSSLKVKEYLATGIPFFLAYNEPVLEQIDGIKDYYYKFENNESVIDMKIVHDFVYSYVNDDLHPEKIRNMSYAFIDYDKISKKLVPFLEALDKKKRM